MRQRIAQQLKDTQNVSALLTTFQEADMTALVELQAKYKDSFQKTHGIPLGFLSVFVRASCSAVQELPAVNAVIDDASGEIVYRDYVNVSVPIPSPRGVVSCVLHGAQAMSIQGLERSIAGLTEKARRDEVSMDDMIGSTFGVVDAGIAGGMLGTGITGPQQSAVLGTNVVKRRAAVVGGKVVARPIMYLSLTYDHRLVDGREAVTFLCAVRDKVEDPSRLLLDL